MRRGGKSLTHLCESQATRFALAGGMSVEVDDIYNKSTDTMDSSRSRKMSTSCLIVNPPLEQMSPIDSD